MTFRKRYHVTIGTVEVVVAYDAELAEYRCRLVVNRVPYEPADYFTDDKDDARHTAWAMARHRVEPKPRGPFRLCA